MRALSWDGKAARMIDRPADLKAYLLKSSMIEGLQRAAATP